MDVLISPTETVVRLALHANRLRTMAHQLAAHIETLSGLTPRERCDLREVPIAMLEQVDAMEGGR